MAIRVVFVVALVVRDVYAVIDRILKGDHVSGICVSPEMVPKPAMVRKGDYISVLHLAVVFKVIIVFGRKVPVVQVS